MPDPEHQKNRPDDTYFIEELVIGKKNGIPVKETFGNLMRIASESEKYLVELFCALWFLGKENKDLRCDYGSCMNSVVYEMYTRYGSVMNSVMVELYGKPEDK